MLLTDVLASFFFYSFFQIPALLSPSVSFSYAFSHILSRLFFSHLSPDPISESLFTLLSFFSLSLSLSLSPFPPLSCCVSPPPLSSLLFPPHPFPSPLSDWSVIHSSSRALIHVGVMIHPECSPSFSLFSFLLFRPYLISEHAYNSHPSH